MCACVCVCVCVCGVLILAQVSAMDWLLQLIAAERVVGIPSTPYPPNVILV